MATNEERRSSDHFLHEVTIDDLQQLTDVHAQQVRSNIDSLFIFHVGIFMSIVQGKRPITLIYASPIFAF